MAIMANHAFDSSNKWKSFAKLSIVLSIIGFSSANAFMDGFGQMVDGMGEQMTAFVDSLYNNVDSWAQHIISHAKDEECHYVCPNGKGFVANKSYEHQPTGCGTFGIKIKDSDLPLKEMRLCCDEHQMCYHVCGADKNTCDEKFSGCLVKKCRDSQKDATMFKGCKTATKLLMMGFLTFGCKTFKDSQRRACICLGNDEL